MVYGYTQFKKENDKSKLGKYKYVGSSEERLRKLKSDISRYEYALGELEKRKIERRAKRKRRIKTLGGVVVKGIGVYRIVKGGVEKGVKKMIKKKGK